MQRALILTAASLSLLFKADLADARGRARARAPAMVGQTPALQGYLELIWVVVPAVACLTAAVIVAALVIKALITGMYPPLPN